MKMYTTGIDTISKDSFSLIETMKKYNLKRPRKISVFSIEDNSDVLLLELNSERKKMQLTNLNDSNNSDDQIANRNLTINTENHYHYNSEETLKTSATNINPTLQRSTQEQFLNVDLTDTNDDQYSNNENLHLSDTEMKLKLLSKNLIYVLKQFSFMSRFIDKWDKTVAQIKSYQYKYIKKKCFEHARDLALQVIIPQGTQFNVIDFLSKTVDIACIEEKFACSYESVKNIYNEFISTCLTENFIDTVNQTPTQIVNGRSDSTHNNFQNMRHHDSMNVNNEPLSALRQAQSDQNHNNVSQEAVNRQSSILQPIQTGVLYNNLPHRTDNIQSLILQEKEKHVSYNGLPQAVYNRQNSILQQNQNFAYDNTQLQPAYNSQSSTLYQEQNDQQYNNLKQTTQNSQSSTLYQQQYGQHCNNLQQPAQNSQSSTLYQTQYDHNYNNLQAADNSYSSTVPQTQYDQHNNNLQQSEQQVHNRHSSISKQVQNEQLNNILQQLTDNSQRSTLHQKHQDQYYNNLQQPEDNRHSSVLQQKHNDMQNNNFTVQNHSQNNWQCNTSYPVREETLQSNEVSKDQQQSSSDQKLPDKSTTCIFKCNYNSYEMRLDINTQLLNCVNNQNGRQNINVVETQMLNQDLNTVQQECTRSMSRDSGFMSPCADQISDSFNENGCAQETTYPFITHVTSLNPKAIHFPHGSCHVCCKTATTKCIKCFKYYYCSNECQRQDWRRHESECTDGRRR